MSDRPEWPDDGRDDLPDVEVPRLDDGATPAAEPATGRERPPTPVTQQIGRVVVLILLGVFVVFAVDNSQRVDFSWVFGETSVTRDPTGEASGGVPLIVLLLLAFAIGALVGAALVRMLKRRRARASEPKGS